MKLQLFIYSAIFLASLALCSNSLSAKTISNADNCEAPIIYPEGQLFLCEGSTIELSTSEAAITYQWYKDGVLIQGVNSNRLIVSEAAAYSVTTTSEGGACISSSDLRTVVQIEDGDMAPKLNVTSNSDFRFCKGEGIELSIKGNFNTILWSTKPPLNTSTITVYEPGTYNVAVKLDGGCSISGSVTVTTMEAPTIYVEVSDTLIWAGESVNLMASGANNLTWFPSDGLNDTTIANPTASPTKTTTYYVTGTSANGCRDTTAVTVYLDDRTLNINPPKVFSPNNDGMDDVWNIPGIESYPNCSVLIFNRQGQEIFSAKPYLNDWDGNFNGRPLPEADYYFVVRGGGQKNLKTGSILLVR